MKKSLSMKVLQVLTASLVLASVVAPAYAQDDSSSESSTEEVSSAEGEEVDAPEAESTDTETEEESAPAEESEAEGDEESASAEDDAAEGESAEGEATDAESEGEEAPAEEQSDWSDVEAAIQEAMQPEELALVFQSDESFEFEGEDVVSRLDRYALFEMTDFHRDFSVSFDDQNAQGAILAMEVTLENNSDEVVYHGNMPSMSIPGTDSLVFEYKNAVGNDFEGYFETTDQAIEPGETKTGIITMKLAPAAMEALEANGTINTEFFSFRDQEDFSGANYSLESPVFNLPFSEDAAAQAAASGEQYPDTILERNMGEKELLDSGEDLAATQEEEEIVVTVDGYQVSQLIPNADYADSVEEIPGGLVLINVKVDVQNNSDKAVRLGQSYASLVLGGLVEVRNDGMYETNDRELLVEPGETGTVYHVFPVEGELYERFKDDTFAYVPRIDNVDSEDMHEYQAIQVEFK